MSGISGKGFHSDMVETYSKLFENKSMKLIKKDKEYKLKILNYPYQAGTKQLENEILENDLVDFLKQSHYFKKIDRRLILKALDKLKLKSDIAFDISLLEKILKEIKTYQEYQDFDDEEKSSGISHDINDVDLYLMDMRELINIKEEDNWEKEDLIKKDIVEDKEKDDKKVQNLHSKRHYQHFIAGAIGGSLSRTITAPLERLKILYQVNYRGKGLEPPNIFQGLKEVYARDGFKGLFRGNLMNLLKATPDTAIKLYMFEKTKSFLRLSANKSDNEKLPSSHLFISGAVAGVTANFTIFPLEVIKTRLSAAPSGTYNGIIDTYKKTYNEGGVKIFYKGVEASILNAIPNSGLQLCFYDLLKLFFSQGNNNENLSTPILMFTGGASAMLSSTLLFPFQTIQARIIMQNHYIYKTFNYGLYRYRCSYPYNYSDSESVSNRNKERLNMIQVISTTFKNEGLRGFFKGYVPGITKVVIGNALGFGLYENIKPLIKF